jgi:nucleoside-diphosphate-sugar epimerase
VRYLITGGTGFVGAYVVAQLLDAGHEVTVYDIAPNTPFLSEVCGAERIAGHEVRVMSGDVSDPFSVLHAMRESGAQRVIHLAATLSGLSDRNPLRALRVNCEGTLNIFESALECGVEKVAWASTIGVFGTPGVRHDVRSDGGTHVLPNDAPHWPEGIYGACKSFNERMASNYTRNRGLNAVGLRFAFTYGYGKALTIARGTRVGFIADLIDGPALGRSARVAGGDTVFDWVYVGDAARSVVLAAEAMDTVSPGLSICGDRLTIKQVAAVVRGLVPDCDLTVEDGTWGDSLNYDGSAAEKEIGYRSEVSIEAGVAQNIADVRRHAAVTAG